MLSDFYESGVYQPSLFDQGPQQSNKPESQLLMSTLDKINRAGKSKIFFAGQGVNNNKGKSWAMKRDHLSPAYTTNWNDILKVK